MTTSYFIQHLKENVYTFINIQRLGLLLEVLGQRCLIACTVSLYTCRCTLSGRYPTSLNRVYRVIVHVRSRFLVKEKSQYTVESTLVNVKGVGSGVHPP